MEEKSIVTRLQELSELLNSGVLNQEEFEALKSELLYGVKSNTPPKTIAKDKDTLITEGIEKSIEGNYKEALDLFKEVLNGEKQLDLLSNRGNLYLIICLIETNEDLKEIRERFQTINFKVLKQNHQKLEEEKVLKIIEYIVDSIKDIKIKDYVFLILNDIIANNLKIDYFTIDSNSRIAKIWFAIANRQIEFKLYEDSLNAIQKAIALNPEEQSYKQKYAEVEELIKNKKNKGKKILKIATVSVVALVLVSVLSFYFY